MMFIEKFPELQHQSGTGLEFSRKKIQDFPEGVGTLR